VGGFQRYVDKAQLFNPDPISTYFVTEAERFDKDFAVADKGAREQHFEKQQDKAAHLRQEHFEREMRKWDKHDEEFKKQEDRIRVRAEVYQAGKKNRGGAAYNIVTLDYDRNKEGERLMVLDADAKVRALMRSKNLD